MGHVEFPPRSMCALVWDRGEWSSRARSVVGKTRCIKIAFQHDLRASTYREIRIPHTMSGMCCSAHSRLPIGQRPLADKNWSMRVAHDAADYWSAGVTEPHIVVGNGHLRRRQDHVPAVGVEAASLLGAPGGRGDSLLLETLVGDRHLLDMCIR